MHESSEIHSDDSVSIHDYTRKIVEDLAASDCGYYADLRISQKPEWLRVWKDRQFSQLTLNNFFRALSGYSTILLAEIIQNARLEISAAN